MKSITINDKHIRIGNKYRFLPKLVFRRYYVLDTMDNCSIIDAMKQLKVINGQNMLILSQNKEIKDELSKFQFEMVTRVEEVQTEIENIKLDIGAVKTSQEFQTGQFEIHKFSQENIQSNYIKQEKNYTEVQNTGTREGKLWMKNCLGITWRTIAEKLIWKLLASLL